MNWGTAFEELDKKRHDRAAFDCGEPALNHFLKTAAAKHMEAGISRTLVLPSAAPDHNQKWRICAFYTVSVGAIQRENFPAPMAKKLPYYPIPIFIIAQLGVDQHYQGTGLGKITLIKALQFLWTVHANLKAFAIVVDCLNQNAENFYLKYGFEVLGQHHGKTRMFIPLATVGQLFATHPRTTSPKQPPSEQV